MMKQSDFTFQTADGLQLYTASWEPEAEPRAVVCLVHGGGEHIGRYAHVAAVLNQAGYAVIGYDQRGHGKSPGQRGHSPTYEALMDDLARFLEQATARLPGKTRFLYGHSLGGNEVLNYVLRRKPQKGNHKGLPLLAGVVATAPVLRFTVEPPAVKVAVGRLLYNLLPTFSLNNGVDARGLSHDPEVVRAYVSDPLVHNRVSARAGVDILASGLWALEHASEFSLPLLLMHGSADPIVAVGGSREFAAKVRGDCTLKVWEGFYHEIHNEPQKQEVFDFLLAWLKTHV
jgi:alpha-beta hydrolase superfamily lysophospholipase